MEPSAEIYVPSQLYVRLGWATVGGSVVCALCGLRAPLALIPGALCGLTAVALFWLSARPVVRVAETHVNIGERTIVWREILEINSSRFASPLVLKLRLTNGRRKLLIYPGAPERIGRLMFQLRRLANSASFDGVAYRDYWTWNAIKELSGDESADSNPVRMVSQEDEDEIERLYQKLRGVGPLDPREDSKTPHED